MAAITTSTLFDTSPVSGPIIGEVQHHAVINGVPVDMLQSAGFKYGLQDICFVQSAKERYARKDALKNLFLATAKECNGNLLDEKTQADIGAMSCVAYIPAAHSTTAPDSIVIGHTGDTSAVLIAVHKSTISVQLLTQNTPENATFFSFRNNDPKRVGRFEGPIIKTYNLSPLRMETDTKLYLGIFSDGLVPGIDNVPSEECIHNAEKHMEDVLQRSWLPQRNWIGDSAPYIPMARFFRNRARVLKEQDCITGIFADISTLPSHGIIMGVFDGFAGNGSDIFAHDLCETMSRLSYQDGGDHLERTP